MGNKQIEQVKRNVRSIAKRCKDVSYSTVLVVLFAMLGGNAFAEAIEVDAKVVSKENIHASATSLGELLAKIKAENESKLEGAELEMIQLMEQGDQVVKSPWSSWQFGLNYMYDEWGGRYKGRGDKKELPIYLRKETANPLERYVSVGATSSQYGRTEIAILEEPIVEISLSASIKPKSINKEAPNFTPSEPSGGLPPIEPRVITPPTEPSEPSIPDIKIENPVDLVFQVGGFGQDTRVQFNNSGQKIVAQNYNKYHSDDIQITTAGNVSWQGTMEADGNKLTTGSYSFQPNTFISDVLDHDVEVTGNYTMENSGSRTMFVSLNPYMLGTNSNTDKIFRFNGNLTLKNTGTSIIGLEHQLLAGYGGGTTSVPNVNTGKTTSILENNGTITLAAGTNMLGIVVDTEYFSDNNNAYFKKQPQTKNNGTIIIGENAAESIGIDYGYYRQVSSNPNLVGPNSKIHLGNIKILGTNSYGFRQKYYGNKFYDKSSFTGENGIITVKGKNNVGISIAEGMSSGDPLSNATSMQLLVGGKNNVGFLRNATGSNSNTSAIVLDSTKIGKDFNFSSEAQNSSLIRSDKDEIILKKDLTLVSAGENNSAMQAGRTGKVTLDASTSIIADMNNFYALTAGDFKGSSGATIQNKGHLNISGLKSVGMAVATSNTGMNSGSIDYTGSEGTGIYNLGNFDITAGNINSSGDKSTSIFNKGTINISGTVSIKADDGATGIYSDGGKIDSKSAENLEINVTAGKGLAVYAKDGANINLQNAKLIGEGSAAGVASEGTGTKIDLTGASLVYEGTGYAIYSDGVGKIDLSSAKLTLKGKSTAFDVDLTASTLPTILNNATRIHANSDDVIAFNLKNATGLTTIGGIETSIKNKIETKLGLGIGSLSNLFTGSISDRYKVGAVDGGSIILGNLDKTGVGASGETTSQKEGHEYFNRFLGQRLLATAIGKEISAILSSAQAARYNNQVIALEMNSSKKANSVNETGIELINSTVTADRTDAGNGAVGLFINYGKISVDKDSKILVEQETGNTANDSAVGVYAVNGSEVENAGDIKVGGKDSIGILGLAYRLDDTKAPVINEFGTSAVGQGKIKVDNTGKITLSGEGATGVYINNNKTTTSSPDHIGSNHGVITMQGDKSSGMSAVAAQLQNDNKIVMQGQESVGMFGKTNSTMINSSSGTITVADSKDATKPNIGIFTKDAGTNIKNEGTIIAGNASYGIYGKNITTSGSSKIEVGDAGVGIFSSEGNLKLDGKIKVGKKEGVGVFTSGGASTITSNAQIEIGDTSFGFVIKNTGSTLESKNAGPLTLGNEATYIYSTDTKGTITNHTTLTSTGNGNYGIYASGTVTNKADMNFSVGKGNVGMYSTHGGTITNGDGTIKPRIQVSESDTKNKLYGIGMAAGYWNETTNALEYTGNIINKGTIEVSKDFGIGMYAVGSGSKAINDVGGVIELNGNNAVGMYLDQGAIGENRGTIKTKANTTKDGMTGVVAMNGAILKNYGKIIIEGSNNIAVYLAKAGVKEEEINQTGAMPIVGGIETKTTAPTGKLLAGIEIKAPGNGTATIERDGVEVDPILIDVDPNTSTPDAPKVNVGTTTLDLQELSFTALPSMAQASDIGMYIDTSGIDYTNPIEGLEHLTNLKKVNLIFGTEAARYTDKKEIKIGTNILSRYNDVITDLSSSGNKVKFPLSASSLTWVATGTQGEDDVFNAAYLVKIPYTALAKDKDTKNFLDGLEQRYGVEGVGSREKTLFNKLNDIGKGEPELLAQAIDEMKGHQYANVQQRIQGTGKILDQEFKYLKKEWDTKSKDSNKIKAFGMRGEYQTDTAGIIDYTNHAEGFAYVHENETVKLGETTGWYTGFVHNEFKFKDIGKSKEDMYQMKLGIFKSMAFDHNNSLNWTVSGEVFLGRNRMHRKYLVVDDIFHAKSRYWSYGAALMNEVSKTFRTGEYMFVRPYGALKMEYGRFQKIKEKDGEMRLEIKSNDYYSVRPEVGVEFGYKHTFANRKTLTTRLGFAYENELGRVADAKNKARVAYTEADWFNIRGEKEDRRGNVKADLNIGLENERYGITANVGYDTKGENVRGGLGFRVIF